MSDKTYPDIIPPCNARCSFCFLNYADVLGNNYLFRGLSAKEIGTIIRKVHHQVRSYSGDDIIAFSGDEHNRLLIIVEGAVVGELTDFEGKVLRMEELKAPDTIASAFIFGDKNLLPVSIKALEKTRILIIPKQDLIRLLRENEKVLHNFLDIMANRAQYLSGRIKLLGLQTIRGKLAQYLLDQFQKSSGQEIRLPHTQNELAEMFGVTRPSIARVIRELNLEKVIASRGRSYRILDASRLSSLLK
jgi:CRP/FNR family transcriptional regulator, dissimilatory nitrate respiration regulator